VRCPVTFGILRALRAKISTGQGGNSVTLHGIPPETFDYRLGSRSALDWVIDQYQVKDESDPNREDDPGYIIRLIGQVIQLSITTAQIVKGLPPYR
jgi:predicted helicase